MNAARNVGQPHIGRREWLLVSAALAALLVLGMILLPAHGQSTDEFSNFQYAANALRAYAGTRNFVGPSYQGLPIDWLYGPFHLEVAYILGAIVERLPVGWSVTDGRHLATFVVFLLGGAGIYALARRRLDPFAAIVAMSLYFSQPVLWGQAFTNQKDVPFLAYFILAVALGLAAADRLRPRLTPTGPRPTGGRAPADAGCRGAFIRDLRSLGRGRRILLGISLAAFGLALLASLLGGGFLPAARGALEAAYDGRAIGPIQLAFNRIATDAYKTPLSLYLDKMDLVYAWFKVPLSLLWLALFLVSVRAGLPSVWRTSVAHLPTGLVLIVAAGAMLGLADSVRVAAPLAGALVSLYMLAKLRGRAWVPLVLYGLSAAVVSYLTWPWLWGAPIARYVDSVKVMSSFPSHNVLFDGVISASSDIPWDYVPKLVAIQTTEVVLPLAVFGLWVMLRRVRHRGCPPAELAVWVLWLVVPVAIVIGLRSPLYGNLRQMLFVLPPLFLLSGCTVEWVVHRLAGAVPRILLVAAVLAPGMIGIAVLHPYADSYFNGWVGWTSGAYGRYQVDPWCTSYRQAVGYLNQHAPIGAVVDVRGPFESARDFARPDLKMYPDYKPAPDPDFALMCRVDVSGDGYQAQLPVVYRVTRGQAVLAVVRGSP